MYIERFNRVLNKVENLEDLEDYKILLDSLINSLEEGEGITIEELIKEKIKRYNGKNLSYIKIRVFQIKESIQKLYQKELKEINKQMNILIKNQRIISSLELKGDEKKERIINTLKFLYNKESQRISELYFSLIEKLKARISEINEICESIKNEKEIHLIKLLLYNYYFTIKLLEEEYQEIKREINKIVEKLNNESKFLFGKLE